MTCAINQTGSVPDIFHDRTSFWFSKGGMTNERLLKACSESITPEKDGV